MDNDHAITGELREWAGQHKDWHLFDMQLTAIADRIEAAHEETILQALMGEGGVPATDENMAEHGWYRALDADKKPIHLGDEVYQVEGGWVYTVKSITFYPENTTVTFECKHGFGCDNAHNVRHYHAPTVEDVLREFGGAYHSLMVESMSDVAHDMPAPSEIIAEYAAKLQLKED